MRLQQGGAREGLGPSPHPAKDGPGAGLLGGEEVCGCGDGGAKVGREGAGGGGPGGPARRGESGGVGEGFREGSWCFFVLFVFLSLLLRRK